MKLEGMFKDMEISKEMMINLKQNSRLIEKIGSLDLNVSVLTDGYWPDYHNMPIHIPEILLNAQNIFKEYYLSNHSGRKLTWLSSLCQCVIKADFPKVYNHLIFKGKKELSMSLFQSVILLLFNDHDSLTTSELLKLTNLEYLELKRTLLSLSCSKTRILIKEPRVPQVEDTDKFSLNPNFSNPHYRIKVNSIQIKETPQEQIDTTEKVFQDRVYVIDAAIVRIMKTRQSLSHELLIAELCNQLKFKTMVILFY
jgi:cullin-4